MKRKVLMIGAVASVLAVGVAGFVSNHSDEQQLTFSHRYNASAVSENKYTVTTEGAHLPGNAVYVVGNHYDNGFFGDNAKVAVYFFNSNDEYAWTSAMTFVFNDAEGRDVYQAIVPSKAGVSSWTNMIACRMNSSYSNADSKDNFWASKWDQTDDIPINVGGYRNSVWVSAMAGKGKLTSTQGLLSAETRLCYLGLAYQIFSPSDWGNDICKNNNTTNTSDLSTSWSGAKTYFESLGADVKGKLSQATANKALEPFNNSTHQASLPGMAARYDYIYAKYAGTLSLSNWADRTVSETILD